MEKPPGGALAAFYFAPAVTLPRHGFLWAVSLTAEAL
jgi:hypothetical protein